MSTEKIFDLVDNDTFKEKMDNIAIAIEAVASGSGNPNITSYKQIQQIVRMGLAPKIFSIGDQIVVEKESSVTASATSTTITSVTIDEDTFLSYENESGTKDYEFTFDGSEWKDTNGEGVVLSVVGITFAGTATKDDKIVVHEVASELLFDIIGFDVDTPTDGNFTHSMTLQSHYVAVTSFQYDGIEALWENTTGSALAAGTYYFTIINYDTTYGGNKSYYFTTTQAIPVGGQIVFNWGYNTQASACKITTYSSDYTTAIETLAVTEGTSGTDLNTLGAGINHAHKYRYGSNSWKYSAAREYLNSEAKAGAWWTHKCTFDRPNNFKAQAGFLHGIDKSFLAVLGKVNKETYEVTCTSDSFTSAKETNAEKVFLLSNKEMRMNTYSDEGQDYAYWTNLIPSKTDAANQYRIKYTNGGSSGQYWWTRTANRGGAYSEYRVNPTGAYSHGYANGSYGLVPACVII